MQYVSLKGNSRPVSRFGMGCMRLPQTKNKDGSTSIDEKEAIRMIRHAIDNGVNYFDTAYVYPGNEELLGKALADGYRQNAHITTKCPLWEIKKHEDYQSLFDEELQRLKVSHIDTYLFHCLDRANWETVKATDGIGFMESLKRQGKIGQIGFSFHADYELFTQIIDAYEWDICMIQLNILDANHQAGVKGLKYAAAKGIPVVIMEPLKGGLLGGDAPEEIAALLDGYAEKRSLVEWAFRWLYNFREAAVIISGVSSMAQLEDNLRIFADAQPDSMHEQDMALVQRIRNIYARKVKIGCTGCGYCMPCPAGVNIPEIFKTYNDASLSGSMESARDVYAMVVAGSGKDASQCAACGLCESHCPQDIRIIDSLKEAHEALTAKE